MYSPPTAATHEIVVTIAASLDVFDFRRSVRLLAARHGFRSRACKELELVASELGTNILKHGIRGHGRAHVFEHPQRGVSLCIEASDEGPAISDLEKASADGWSSHGPLDPAEYCGRPGIGAGLGAIRRLTDEFLYSRNERGNHFKVVLYRER